MPHGAAMNDCASPEECHYQSLQDVLSLVRAGFYLAKVDLKSPDRSVKFHPSNRRITALHWTFEGDSHPTFMIDTRLPFSSRKAPAFLNRLTQAVQRMMARRGYQGVVYLDDFLILGGNKEECTESLNALMSLVWKVSFYINYKKVACPCRRLTFLGIDIDTDHMTVALPHDKLEDLQQLLQTFSARQRASRKQLESLAEKLSWASQVIKVVGFSFAVYT